MFDLVFLFTGLSAFVLDNPAQPQTLDVLLVDARQSDKTHRSVLVVRNDESQTSDWQPPDPYGRDHRGAFIEGFRIMVEGVSAGSITFESERPVGSICPANAEELAAYGWVPKLGKVAYPGKASAALKLTNGTLATRSLGRYDDFARSPSDRIGKRDGTAKRDGIAIWTFNDSRCPAATALADVVEFRQQIAGSSVKIELRDLDSGDLVHTLTLRPSTDVQVVVEIKNVPEGEICCQLRDGVSGDYTDMHFGELTKLLPSTSPKCVPTLTLATCPGPVDHPALPNDLCFRGCEVPANPQCPGADQSGP